MKLRFTNEYLMNSSIVVNHNITTGTVTIYLEYRVNWRK